MSEKNSKLWSHSFLNDFRLWVEESEKNGDIKKGIHVKAHGAYEEILENIDCPFHKHTEKMIVKCFIKHGGIIKEVFDDLYLIKTKRGKFYIKKEFAEEV